MCHVVPARPTLRAECLRDFHRPSLARSLLGQLDMRPLARLACLLLTTTAFLGCTEDDASPNGAGGAAGSSVGGSGGSTVTPKIKPGSDPNCPGAAPESGEACGRADDSAACIYDGLDCQSFDALCKRGVWTVLVRTDPACPRRPCPNPSEIPSDGDACEESAIVGSNDCRYNQSVCGKSTRAICNGQTWSVGPADDLPSCYRPCPDAAPTIGSACTGYTSGCYYENSCQQGYYAQCSGNVWVTTNGRPTCTSNDCPTTIPEPGENCVAFTPNLYCPYPTTCGSDRTARCNDTKWVVPLDPCAN